MNFILPNMRALLFLVFMIIIEGCVWQPLIEQGQSSPSPQDVASTSMATTALAVQESPVSLHTHEAIPTIDDDRSEGAAIPYPTQSHSPDSSMEGVELFEHVKAQREGSSEEGIAKNGLPLQGVLPVLDATLSDHSKLPPVVESVPGFFDQFPVGRSPANGPEPDRPSEIKAEDQSLFDAQLGSEIEDLQSWEMRLPIPSSNGPASDDHPGERIGQEAGSSSETDKHGVFPPPELSEEQEKDKLPFPSVVDEIPKPMVTYKVPQVLFPGFDAMAIPSGPDETTLQEKLSVGSGPSFSQLRDAESEVVALGEMEPDKLSEVETISPWIPEGEMSAELEVEQSGQIRNSLSLLNVSENSIEERSQQSKELERDFTFLGDNESEEERRHSEELIPPVNDSTNMTDIQKSREVGDAESIRLPKRDVTVEMENLIGPKLEETSEEGLKSIAELSIGRQLVSNDEESPTQLQQGKGGIPRDGPPDNSTIKQFPLKNAQERLFHDEDPKLADDSGGTELNLETNFDEGDQKKPSPSRNVEVVEGETRVRQKTQIDQKKLEPPVRIQPQEPQVATTPLVVQGQEVEVLGVGESLTNGLDSPRSFPFMIGPKSQDTQQLPSQTMSSSTRELLGCQRGRAQLAGHRYQEAILSFSQSIEATRPKKVSDETFIKMQDCFRQRAYAYLQLNIPIKALSDITYVLKWSKSDAHHRNLDIFFRGRLYVILHDSQRAIDDLTMALEDGLEIKARAYAYYLRGISYLRLKRIEPGLQDVSEGCRQNYLEACQFLEQIL